MLSLKFAIFAKNVENGISGLFQPKYTKKVSQKLFSALFFTLFHLNQNK